MANVLKGGTRQMETERRTRHIDLCWVRDVFFRTRKTRRLLWKSGKLLCADIGTKFLAEEPCARLTTKLLIVSI